MSGASRSNAGVRDPWMQLETGPGVVVPGALARLTSLKVTLLVAEFSQHFLEWQ